MFDQLGSTNLTVFSLTEKRMRLFRPPYGSISEEELAAGYSNGFYTINWDVDTRDWDKAVTGEQIVEKVKEQVKPGSIILMHSVPWILRDRLEALKAIIEYIKNELGYEFTTVNDLLGIPGYLNDVVCAEVLYHVVAQGETLSRIAKKYGVTVKEIVEKNGIQNPDVIHLGQKLVIPSSAN